jgi:DNA-binding NarL/FixJ family response regulator
MHKRGILVVDDHAMMREGVSAVLNRCRDIEVVGEGADGREALSIYDDLKPDIVLMDIVMPGIDGIETTRRIKDANPEALVLMLSKHEGSDYVLSSMKAGADGYVPKTANAIDLIAGIRAVLRHGCYVHPQVARAVIGTPPSLTFSRERYDELALVDREILALVARSRTCGEIAGMVGLSRNSVARHRARMIRDFGGGSVSGFLRFAVQVGATDLRIGSRDQKT